MEYNHFKVEKVHPVADLFQPHCCMIRIDLKYDFYSLTISEEDAKFLKFHAGKNLLKFFVLQNGLSSSLRKFKKLTKLPIACLRTEGVLVAIYMDDIIVIGALIKNVLSVLLKLFSYF